MSPLPPRRSITGVPDREPLDEGPIGPEPFVHGRMVLAFFVLQGSRPDDGSQRLVRRPDQLQERRAPPGEDRPEAPQVRAKPEAPDDGAAVAENLLPCDQSRDHCDLP